MMIRYTTIVSLLAVCGCAATTIQNDPEKIKDSGKANTVVLSYDVTLNALDRHPQARVAHASLCQESGDKTGIFSSFTANNRCFKMSAKFEGTSASEDGLMLERFATKGSHVHQKKYGEYLFKDIGFRVLVDKQPELVCQETSVNKKTRVKTKVCNTRIKNVYKSYKAALANPISLNVTGGTGCYLGHISIEMKGDELIADKISIDIESLDFALISEPIREKIKAHVTRSCNA